MLSEIKRAKKVNVSESYLGKPQIQRRKPSGDVFGYF